MSSLYEEFTPDIYEEMWRPHMNEIIGADGLSYGEEVLGVDGYGQSFGVEVGGDAPEQEAIYKTIEKARDNRRPAPEMQAVDVDTPIWERDQFIELIGAAAEKAPAEPFPLTTALVKRYVEGTEAAPRIVRVDTEESYRAFRTADSPERMELLRRLSAVEEKLAAHIADPDAHDVDEMEEDMEEATEIGAWVSDVEAKKQIPLRMPHHFDGLLEAWHEEGLAGATLILPRADGGRWFVTASEPIETGVLEAAKAATEAGVRAAEIVGYLPAIGASLAQANAMKALAAGAGSILRQPEAKGTEPFVKRLEPKASPALFALRDLAKMCAAGNAQACEEWNRLAAAGPAPLRQAMGEILAILKSPPQTAIGGSVGDWFKDLWAKVCRFFETDKPEKKPASPALPGATPQKALPAKATAVA